MTTYRLSPRAKQDISEIWKATVERWSAGQAEFHIRQIQASIDDAAEDASKARSCGEIRKGYLKFTSGSHVLFSRRSRDGLEIIRIVSSAMDFEAKI
jgi:toxin ParE1/3/4